MLLSAELLLSTTHFCVFQYCFSEIRIHGQGEEKKIKKKTIAVLSNCSAGSLKDS